MPARRIAAGRTTPARRKLRARTGLQVRLRLGNAVDFILPGATGPRRRPSQIRDARTGKIMRR